MEMSQQFQEDGTVVPVTWIHAEPCVVIQVCSWPNGQGMAVQIGCDSRRYLNKPESGHTKECGLLGTLREFSVIQTDLKRGDKIDVSVFQPGEHVDVIGVSKGRGFTGVVKRHHFSGSPASHGHKDQLRMPGSIGSRRQGPVQKGKRMAGHMGTDRVTVKNLEIVSVDLKKNRIAIKGAVPGAQGGIVSIQLRESQNVWQK